MEAHVDASKPPRGRVSPYRLGLLGYFLPLQHSTVLILCVLKWKRDMCT